MIWGVHYTYSAELDKEELLKKLTPLQYEVTQHSATERPFSGEYNNLMRDFKKVPTGANMTVKHADGMIFEYVEHDDRK